MKAIETVYRGYRFRSRLEARWAVFFDELGLEWQYEPEGFDLPSGLYLPDFFIPFHPSHTLAQRHPGAGYWVEVKGREPDRRETALLCELAAATGHSSYLVIGAPGEQGTMRANRDGTFSRHREPDLSPVFWLWSAGFVDTGPGDMPSHADVSAAMYAARQARFEHGQRGAPRHWDRPHA